jgi:hypothetical protein
LSRPSAAVVVRAAATSERNCAVCGDSASVAPASGVRQASSLTTAAASEDGTDSRRSASCRSMKMRIVRGSGAIFHLRSRHERAMRPDR